jgi:acyl carrier protein
MTELEEHIIALIVEETGIKRERIQLGSRLADDIGMDGDDAVEFFEKFGKKFQVDLTSLHGHWHQHFGPEWGGPGPGFLMVIIGAAVIAGDLVHDAVRWIPTWLAMIGLIGMFGGAYFKFFNRHQNEAVPVTVQDLIDAASSGKWVKQGSLF